MTSEETMARIDQQINRSNISIERHIDNIDFTNRGCVSQDVLQDLRTFVQTIMLRIYAENNEVTQDYGKTYSELVAATQAIRTKVPFLGKFFDYIQIVASHYTLEPESAERVMLKYMEFLIKIKKLAFEMLNLKLLNNLEKFPIDIDKNLQKYYMEIAKVVENQQIDEKKGTNMRCYIHKIKPFFVNSEIYYEVTFSPATDKSNKSDRIIAFTKIDISNYYASKLWTVSDNINILNRQLPILIIKKWEVAIRPIEIENLGRIFGATLRSSAASAEGRGLMQYLQNTRNSLVDLVTSDEDYYNYIKNEVMKQYNAKVSNIFDVLSRCRKIILNNSPGSNVLRYLLLHLNNKILKSQIQISNVGNGLLSNLFLSYGCKPFDEMPFDSSLIGHNPKLRDLFECIDSKSREYELFARFIRQNTEQNGVLYTPKEDLKDFSNPDQLAETFNSKIYYKHKPEREIRQLFNNYFYIYSDQQSTIKTLEILETLSKQGLNGYSAAVDRWLQSSESNMDDECKKDALKGMFENSKVALIYGSAGTGKTTLINYISTLFRDESRLYLAQTNPAVDNLKRRVVSKNANTNFFTITRFLKQRNNRKDYDILFIDECSTISNMDIKNVLEKAKIGLLVLVGDTYQIESIRFGNWFSLAKKFLSPSVIELNKPFRSSNNDLITFWDKVRNNSNDIQEIDARLHYSSNLDQTIFQRSAQDEIILCLNYDGLYGINNVNTLLQQNNPKKEFKWGFKSYKVDDPVLFSESERFKPIIYNNLKGWIRDIKLISKKIQFDIEIDKTLTELDLIGYDDIELVKYDHIQNSVIRFSVDSYALLDENGDGPESSIIPFQVAYAVSIHKSQGLEYDSVKIVITDEVGEQITHSIFYTAITRARSKLKIYWSPEVEHKIVRQLTPRNINKDFDLLKSNMQNEN